MAYFFSDEVFSMRADSFTKGQEDGKRLMKAAVLAKFDEWVRVCTAGNSLALRGAAGDLGLALPDIVWQGRARDFCKSELSHDWPQNPGDKLYMRAYSHGPWICIEPDQLAKVYADESSTSAAGDI